MKSWLRLRRDALDEMDSLSGLKTVWLFTSLEGDLLEFPNASTKVTKALVNQLRDMLGRDNVQVEKYFF